MTRLNLVRKATAPVPPYNCELTCFDVNMVPFYLGALWLRAQKYWWLTSDDQRIARSALNEEMVRLLMPCGQDIVDSIDRVYRLIDGSINGNNYIWWNEPDLPADIRPALPVVPDVSNFTGDSMRASSLATKGAWRRMLLGFGDFNYWDAGPSIPAQLDEILAAIEAGGFDQTEILSKLTAIIAALG